MNQFGVKKTTVDELVKRVSIPKGTFYLFYPSKEQLFFDVFLDKHNAIQQTFFLRRENPVPIFLFTLFLDWEIRTFRKLYLWDWGSAYFDGWGYPSI